MSPDESLADILAQTIDITQEDVYLFPASYAQRRLWFLDQFEPGSPFYNIPTAIRLFGTLNIGVLERAFNEIVRRHESLRTVFIGKDGEPMQVIYPEVRLALPVVDLRYLHGENREAEALRQVNEEARRPFDLSVGPLLRGRLLQLDDEEYIAVITMHHIVSDGWSMAIFVQELAVLYDRFQAGRPSPLPELEIQYADYAEWQRDWLQGEVLEEQVEYWRQALAGIPPVLELPTDRPRPAVQSSVGASATFRLPKDLVEALKTLGMRESATTFMTFLAAFQTLLHRYSGQTDIAVGTPVAGRNQAEIEGLIGFFVNTLVLRADYTENPSFLDLLKQVRETALGAYAHQNLPFEMLVEALAPERDMSHTPLFQAMFILQTAPVQAKELPSLRLQQIEVDQGTSTFDITMSMTEQREWMAVSIEYNTDLFDAGAIERMIEHFQVLLAGIVANPDQPVSTLPLMSAAERHKMLETWNDTAVDFPRNLCVHHLVEMQVERSPEAVAVVAPASAEQARQRQALSYRQFNAQANRLAHYLRHRGVGPETVVGLCLDRSAEMMVGLLAISKAGGAFLPLDPSYPPERLTYMLEDAGAKLVLSQNDVLGRVPELARFDPILLDVETARIREQSDENPNTAVQPENLAYIIYTSGSTGEPKGVMVPHYAVVNHNLAMVEQFGLTPADRMLQFATISFDAAVEEIFPTWMTGATLVLRPDSMLVSGTELLRMVQEEQLTILDLPTAYWHEWVHELTLLDESLPQSLRLVILGGQKASGVKLADWERLSGREQAWINTYGPTETTVVATTYKPAETHSLWDAGLDPPIGLPIANVKAYILEKCAQQAPVGVRGELCIGGVAVTRGYLNRPALTAESFIPDPFSGEPGARMYRTGDQARRLPDGNIQFLGRRDDQVKVRGFRVELGEIEAVLQQHASIRQAVAEVYGSKEDETRLVAYATSDREPGPTEGELRAYLKSRLPDFMVPQSILLLAELPLTPAGKVDLRSLPGPEGLQKNATAVELPPRTPVESALAELWTQILGVKDIGVHDNFFDLGGHSLLATQLVAHIRQTLQVEIPVRTIFESPTLATLAGVIETTQRSPLSVQPPPIAPVPRGDDLPLSFAQQRLWFLDQLQPNSPFYNIPESVRLVGPLDVNALERSLNAVVIRHESLRTTFHFVDDQPVQRIATDLFIPLAIQDLSDLPSGQQETAVKRLAYEEAQRPFDLSSGPLLRAGLLRLGKEEHVILVTVHHIISDNWSSNILISEIATYYDAIQKGETPRLPALALQYVDYAHWQRNWLQGEVLARELSYWKEQLAGAPPLLELPTDRPRPAVQSFAGDYTAFHLSEDLGPALQGLCAQEGATLFMVMLAAFQVLLHRYSGQDDISIGTPIANRNYAETESIIGFFVNTLVLRSDLSGSPTFRELLRQVRETALDAYAHQDIPFEMVVEAVRPERNLSQSPLFQVMFSMQNVSAQPQVASALRMIPVDAHSGAAKFDLTLFIQDQDGRLSGALEFNTDLFDHTTIERMLTHFERLLTAIVANPDQSISALPLLGEDERRQIVLEWNQNVAEFPDQLSVQQLFEAQVQRTPEAVAVAFGDETMTYAELNARANQLAHYLRELGVGPDVLVGISAERKPEVVVGLLGILKAGGAYLPIDPTYPQERIQFMVEDSGIEVLLTRSEGGGRRGATISLDAEWPEIAKRPDTNPAVELSPDHLAYVIYTSGSTGRPKGTMVHHRGVVNYLRWCQQAYPLSAGQGSPVHSSISFDLTVTSLFSPLVSGGKVQLVPEDKGIEGLGDVLLAKGDFSLVKITPAHLQLLSQQTPPALAPGLTHAFIIGGENLLVEHIDFWREHAPATALVNEYGPTETVVGCCVYQVPPDAQFHDSIPIGRPIINTQLYILDEHLRPVPVGVVGELYIGGSGVARGYHQRPALTAARFIPNPFASPGETARGYGARLYKTGDLVRYRPDGNIEFLGRTDHQVKIRGYRIELGEVEAILSQHPAVGEVAALALAGPSGANRLLVYYVLNPGERADAPELQEFIRMHAPGYMVPSAFILLEAMPLDEHGKIKRKALPKFEQTRDGLDTPYIEPRTDLERFLVEQWQEVLGVERVGIRDNFFDLGGHSLVVVHAVNRVQEKLGVKVEVSSIFFAPTIAEQSEYLDEYYHDQVATAFDRDFLSDIAWKTAKQPGHKRLEKGEDRGGSHISRDRYAHQPILPVSREQELPLSFAQQRLWFLNQLEPNNPFYNMPTAVGLHGPLDVSALARALDEIVQRHETLRTRFISIDGKPQQVIVAPTPLVLAVEDLSHLPEQEHRPAAENLAYAEAERPFDLERGPLFRARLVRLAEDDHVLLFTLHHIISDGWSMGVMIRELATLYRAFTEGMPSPLPELPIQYADFAYWQRHWLQGEVLEAQLNYWRRQLSGAPALLELPTDRPRPPVQTHHGATKVFTLGSNVLTELQSLARQHDATLYMILLAAFQTLMYRYSGQEDISVGAPIANRSRSEIEGLIGFFVNTLVMRTDLSGAPGFTELLARVRQTALEAYSHQDLPFEYLVDALDVERKMSHSPLFQVMFTLDTKPDTSSMLSGDLSIRPINAKTTTARYDLVLSMIQSGENLAGSFEYNTDLFDERTIERMLGHFQVVLKGIITDPEQSIATLPLLSEEERAQLAAWNATKTHYPLAEPVHRRFEQFAAEQPLAPAVTFVGAESETLTYAELNARANQLAHHLRGLGVGPETLVGVCVERSVEMVVGLLGILKAGGAYLPIDPNYPQERIAFMIGDAGIDVLLVQTHLLAQLPVSDVGSNAQYPVSNTILLDNDWPEISQQPDVNPAVELSPDDLAYVIYTSGSTGRPKGVMLQHRGLTNLVWAQTEGFDITARQRVLQFASFSFDASVSETFMALCTGAELVLASPEKLAAGAELLALLRDGKINVATLPPSLLSVLEPKALPELEVLISAGEACSWEIVARWSDGRRMVNAYGPTEATVGPLYCLLDEIDKRQSATAPIGRPIGNTRAYVLNAYGQLAPVGVPGELCIGGVCTARGYLNQAGLTADKFAPDGYGGDGSSRLYRTGDLARYLPDGNLEYLGRIDHQVKVRGFRIELGEIESVLEQHEQVKTAVVLVRGDPSGTKRLVGYVIPAGEAAPRVSELKAHVQSWLPEYMTPSIFVTLAAFPLTPNNKIDRQALPAPELKHSTLEGEYVAPRDMIEAQLVQLWEGLLNVHPIGVKDDFFSLGGHSLLAVQLLAAIERQVGRDVSLVALFQEPTIEHLAGLLRQQAPEAIAALVPLQPQGDNPPIFFIHPSGGSVHWYMDLAGALAPDQPLFGLQAQGLYGDAPLHTTVEEMAAHYVQAIRSAQPQGPYRIGSWSMGVIIAFEAAQQLVAAGQAVSPLFMLDQGPFPPGQPPRDNAEYLVEFFGKALPLSLEMLRELEPDAQVRFVYDSVRTAGIITPDFTLNRFKHMYDILKVHEDAWHRYIPTRYPGDVQIFLAADRQEKTHRISDLRWSEVVTGDVTVIEIPGDHHGILHPPNLDTLVAYLRDTIAQKS
jgi:amino acid adenylation domain-containing protein